MEEEKQKMTKEQQIRIARLLNYTALLGMRVPYKQITDIDQARDSFLKNIGKELYPILYPLLLATSRTGNNIAVENKNACLCGDTFFDCIIIILDYLLPLEMMNDSQYDFFKTEIITRLDIFRKNKTEKNRMVE